MSELDSLVIDVSRITGTPDLYVDTMCESVEMLQKGLGKVCLGRVTSDFYFDTPTPLRFRDLNNIHWRRRTADLHGIVTDQPLTRVGEKALLGLAWVRPSEYVLGDRHALVMHETYRKAKLTAVHEFGHLILGSVEGHCTQSDCLMYNTLTKSVQAKYMATSDPVQFCDGCMEKMDTSASALIAAKRLDYMGRTGIHAQSATAALS